MISKNYLCEGVHVLRFLHLVLVTWFLRKITVTYFPYLMKFCARNTKLQIGTILTESKSRARLYPDMIISAFAINKTDSKRSAISIIFHAHLFCYFAKMLKWSTANLAERERECKWLSLHLLRRGGGVGGEQVGTQQMFILGRFDREVQPLPFLRTIFDGKGTSFFHLLLTNRTPFPYLLWNFASLLNSQNQNVFSNFLETYKCIC